MTVKNKTNKNYKRSQKGRSMVEMLGVLAIIGVLSVGGVYGYGVAMKKHKANELLHQASMLATTISAQIQSKGELPTTIENFGDAKYGTFSTPTKANDEQFEMKITGMDSAVCEQMEKMSGGMVRKAECSGTTLTLTYNNNLSSEPVSADYNGSQEKCEDAGYKWCSEKGSSGSCSNTSDCCAGVALDSQCQTECNSDTGEITNKEEGALCEATEGVQDGICMSGKCIKDLCKGKDVPDCKVCDPKTGEISNSGSDVTCDFFDTGDGFCNEGVCEKKCAFISPSRENSECGGWNSNYYCHFDSKPDGQNGICKEVTGAEELSYNGYAIGPSMNWWSAYTWCTALGRNLHYSDSLTYYYIDAPAQGTYCIYPGFEAAYDEETGEYSDKTNVCMIGGVTMDAYTHSGFLSVVTELRDAIQNTSYSGYYPWLANYEDKSLDSKRCVYDIYIGGVACVYDPETSWHPICSQ